MEQCRIMFVCLGNICRSPAAQAVLETKIREAGLESRISAESSGTDAYHVGEQSDSRMRQTAAVHGVSINHKAQQFRKTDLSDYNMIVAMDANNHHSILSMCSNEEQKSRVVLFRDFDPEGTGDVPDPWYGGPEGFETVWEILDRTADALLEHALDSSVTREKSNL